MNDGFIDLRQNYQHLVEDSFWPSFTDIMTVVVMIFLITTSILIVKNWELVDELKTRIEVEQKISQRLKASMVAQQKTSQELEASLNKRQEIMRKLQESLEAERRASEVFQKTSKEKATLEERLTQTQSELSMLRLQLMQARESASERDKLILEQDQSLTRLKDDKRKLKRTIAARDTKLQKLQQHLVQLETAMDSLNTKLEVKAIALSRRDKELQARMAQLHNREQELLNLTQQNQQYQDSISRYERQIAEVRQQHSVLVGDYEVLEDKYNKLIKPSRSAIGKYVVEVRYEKQAGKPHIQFRESDHDPYQAISEATMHKKLSTLKEHYKDRLYVKIIIPDDSGLSYNEAWTFMSSVLDKYDYYYQDD